MSSTPSFKDLIQTHNLWKKSLLQGKKQNSFFIFPKVIITMEGGSRKKVTIFSKGRIGFWISLPLLRTLTSMQSRPQILSKTFHKRGKNAPFIQSHKMFRSYYSFPLFPLYFYPSLFLLWISLFGIAIVRLLTSFS